jgi:hypothetical protein
MESSGEGKNIRGTGKWQRPRGLPLETGIGGSAHQMWWIDPMFLLCSDGDHTQAGLVRPENGPISVHDGALDGAPLMTRRAARRWCRRSWLPLTTTPNARPATGNISGIGPTRRLSDDKIYNLR